MFRPQSPRFSAQAGIALGPILFILAILAIIGAVLASGGGGFSVAGVADRVKADIVSQANLIRAKIYECNLMYGTNGNGDGYPDSGGVSVAIKNVNCTGDPAGLQNIWTGNRAANLPPPTSGFSSATNLGWYYLNTNSSGFGGTAVGGRCVWIKPNSKNQGVVAGLTSAAAKFTSALANDGKSEVNYNPDSANQRFVVWISSPPTPGQEANDCNSNM